MPGPGPPPPGGDQNRASEVLAFTWTLEIVSVIFVVGRMYSRTKLTRNVWWDDWCVCFALVRPSTPLFHHAVKLISQVLDFVVAVMWSVYAASGYARHLYYLNPAQISKALELNTISRSLCMFSIAIGKISVAFLIERIAGPTDWRKWLLRGISITVFVSAVITFTFFYAQCQPARAIWDKSLIKEGTGSCWNPIPVNTWNLVIASKLLDFICRRSMLTSVLSRLLGISGFCTCFHPGRYRLEAPVEHTKKATLNPTSRYGSLVSDPLC